MNLVELAEYNVKKFDEHTKLYYQDKEYTNLDLIKTANRLANGLREIGIEPGDKVLVMLLNAPEVFISYQGILRAGAIIIPTIFLLGPREISHIMKNSGATAIITSAAFKDNAQEAAEGIETMKHIIIVEDQSIEGTITYQSLIEGQSEDRPDFETNEDDNAVILYTSGTTGVPKGVMLTHRNLYSNALSSYKLGSDRDPNDISLFILPLSHSFGLTMMNTNFLFPNKSVMMPWFDIEQACQLIEKYKITSFTGVPTIYSLLLNSPEITNKYDLSSLEECRCGSAPLPAEVIKKFEAKFDCSVLEGYGLSEASPVVTAQYKDRPKKYGSIGHAVPDVEVKIVDDNNEPVGPNEIGELIVKGPNVSSGYYQLPEETAQTFRNGWLQTGDMARMDDEGYIFIVDRKKDLIIRGGFNIIPRDVEEILLTHPQLIEAAVIGVPDEKMGEEVKAFVVVQDKTAVTAEELIEHCQQHLAKYKCPKIVEFLDVLPRNAIGKLLRKELRIFK